MCILEVDTVNSSSGDGRRTTYARVRAYSDPREGWVRRSHLAVAAEQCIESDASQDGSDTSQGGGASEGNSQGDSEVETGSGTDDSDDGEEFTKPVWTEATQHQIGCCPVCGDVKSLAWRYHDPKQGEVPVCGRCHFFHLHNTCLF